MILSETGDIVISEGLKSPEFKPDMNILLDEFVIMPNHFHGIIQIGVNEYNVPNEKGNVDCGGRRDAIHCAATSRTNKGLFKKGNNKFRSLHNTINRCSTVE
jgi:putative transposase